MGCGTSKSESSNNPFDEEVPAQLLTTEMAMRGIKPTETVYQAFKRLDEQICKLESTCAGPRLATAEAWIEYLESTVNNNNLLHSNIPDIDNDEDNPNYEKNTKSVDFKNVETNIDKEKIGFSKVRQLAIQLGIAFDLEKAASNEEFVASVSRDYMDEVEYHLINAIIEHAKSRAETLLRTYNDLRKYYAEQDGLIVSVNGGTYSSKREQHIDNELELARHIRDKLGGVSEQWRTSANLLRTSAKVALQATEYWKLVEHSRIASERITLAIDCRSSIQESIVALSAAQKALPQVSLHHISQRQVSAVQHANIYLLTDMANPKRYSHTKNVLESYQNNVNQAVKWLHETFQNTLRKDFDHADDNVTVLAKELREERLQYIQQTVGNSTYVRAAGLS